MKNTFYILIALVLLMLACGRPSGNAPLFAELQRAEELMYPAPDSALHILQTMTPPKDELNHATWALLLTQAKYKCDVEQSDSLLNIAHNYFMEKENAQRKALTLYLKGGLLNEKNQQDKALPYYLKSADKCEESNDFQLAYFVNSHLARMYLLRKLYDYAMSHCYKAKDFALLTKNPYYIGDSYLEIARAFSAQNMHQSAFEFYDKAIMIGRNDNEQEILTTALIEKMAMHIKKKEFNEALNIASDINRSKINLQGHFALGYLSYCINQIDSAYYYLNKSVQSENIYTQRSSYQVLFNLSKNQNDYKKNAEYSVKLWKINDSINKIDKHKALIEMQEKYDEQRVRDEMTTQMALQKQRTIMGIGAAVLILCFIAYRIRIRNRERIIRLAEAEDRIETLNRMLEEAQKATSADEKDSAFFKRILLQQLGVIRLVANTPTAQNQALLRQLAEIGKNGEAPDEELIVWEDLYPIIDRLYDNFHTRLTSRFGSLLTEKEVQTCCLLCAGFSTKEIAVITRQAVTTVYARKTTSRQKMGAPDGADIVEWVKKEELQTGTTV